MAHRHEAVGLASYCTTHQVRVSENSPRESGSSCKISKSQNLKIFWHAQAKTCMQLTQFACKPTEMQAVDMHAGTKSRIQNPESRIQNPDPDGGIVGFRSDSSDDPGIRDAPSCLHGAAELQKVLVHLCKIVRPFDSARRPAKS